MTWGGGATSLHTCSVTEQPRCLAFKCLKACEKSSTWGDSILKLTRGVVCLPLSFPLGKTSSKTNKKQQFCPNFPFKTLLRGRGATHKTISAGGKTNLAESCRCCCPLGLNPALEGGSACPSPEIQVRAELCGVWETSHHHHPAPRLQLPISREICTHRDFPQTADHSQLLSGKQPCSRSEHFPLFPPSFPMQISHL